MTAPRRHFIVELAFFAGSVAAMYAFVWGLTWSYPLGHTTLWTIGMVAVASVAAMGLPSLMRAWHALREDRGPRRAARIETKDRRGG